MQTLAALFALAFAALLTGWLARLLVLKVFRHMRDTLKTGWSQVLMHDKVLRRIAKAVPSLIVQFGVMGVPYLEPRWSTLITNVAIAFTVYHLARALCDLLNAMNEAHERDEERKAAAQTHSIKSYVQLGSNDMLRVGDWIEMPQVGADGFVIDIALNTVKVQNFDKTITTIPTWRLMSDSFKNWRGMFEAGGRRIQRSLSIDAHSIHMLSKDERHALSDIALLRDYWNEKTGLRAVDDVQPGSITAQSGHLIAPNQVSNLAAFKAYAYAYLLAHPRIHQGPGMFLLARTLEPSPQGVPLQLYCYTNTTIWVEYEAIQGEIFDHLIAMLPHFGLKLYQRSSDYGMHYPVPGPVTTTPTAM